MRHQVTLACDVSRITAFIEINIFNQSRYKWPASCEYIDHYKYIFCVKPNWIYVAYHLTKRSKFFWLPRFKIKLNIQSEFSPNSRGADLIWDPVGHNLNVILKRKWKYRREWIESDCCWHLLISKRSSYVDQIFIHPREFNEHMLVWNFLETEL